MIGRLTGMRGRSFTVPGVLLVAIAAALWGLDPILRKPLAKTTEATTIIFGEHVLLVLLTLPFLLPRCARCGSGRSGSASR